MFIGHFAVGVAGKKLAPKASLPALLFAALFADILWPVLVAVGAEKVRIAPGNTVYTPLEFVSYPWSHSLLLLLIWGGLIGAFFRKRTDGRRIWAVIAALVVSHWFLDWITHAPDMPVYPGGERYGLGLWNNVNLTMIVEIVLYVVGVWMYMSVTRARDWVGRHVFSAFVAFLPAFFLVDSFDSSAPPSVKFIWVSALIASAVVLAWAAWIDKHREVKTGR